MEFIYLKKLISDDKNTNTVVIQTVFIHCNNKKKKKWQVHCKREAILQWECMSLYNHERLKVQHR